MSRKFSAYATWSVPTSSPFGLFSSGSFGGARHSLAPAPSLARAAARSAFASRAAVKRLGVAVPRASTEGAQLPSIPARRIPKATSNFRFSFMMSSAWIEGLWFFRVAIGKRGRAAPRPASRESRTGAPRELRLDLHHTLHGFRMLLAVVGGRLGEGEGLGRLPRLEVAGVEAPVIRRRGVHHVLVFLFTDPVDGLARCHLDGAGDEFHVLDH